MGISPSVNGLQLLVSNPPHGDVDAAEAASHFGLAAAEVGMKANYGLPEIWFAAEDEAGLLDTAAALGAAGLETVLVAGSDLVEVPGQDPAESFTFTDEGLQVDRDDSERTLAYDTPAIAVFCRPQVEVQEARGARPNLIASRLSSWGRGFRRPSPGSGLVELVTSPFLDLYVPSEIGLLRISIVPGVTDFSLLPDLDS